MSYDSTDALELDLPKQHGWLLLAPAADILGLLLLFPLFLHSFTAAPGIEVEAPSSRFVLRDFADAPQLWIPADPDTLMYQGRLINEATLIEQLDLLAAAASTDSGPDAILIRADRAVSYQRVAHITELATSRGLRVGQAALMSQPLEESPE